jgi:hypothetical protein
MLADFLNGIPSSAIAETIKTALCGDGIKPAVQICHREPKSTCRPGNFPPASQ